MDINLKGCMQQQSLTIYSLHEKDKYCVTLFNDSLKEPYCKGLYYMNLQNGDSEL
jgi:hypothetical protein